MICPCKGFALCCDPLNKLLFVLASKNPICMPHHACVTMLLHIVYTVLLIRPVL